MQMKLKRTIILPLLELINLLEKKKKGLRSKYPRKIRYLIFFFLLENHIFNLLIIK